MVYDILTKFRTLSRDKQMEALNFIKDELYKMESRSIYDKDSLCDNSLKLL